MVSDFVFSGVLHALFCAFSAVLFIILLYLVSFFYLPLLSKRERKKMWS